MSRLLGLSLRSTLTLWPDLTKPIEAYPPHFGAGVKTRPSTWALRRRTEQAKAVVFSPLETFCYLLFALWLVATVVYQLATERLAPLVRRLCLYPVLPSYQLFAHLPVDLALEVRSLDSAARASGWQRIGMHSPHRWHHALWHPGFHGPHLLSTLIEDLLALDVIARKRGRALNDLAVASRTQSAVWRHLWSEGYLEPEAPAELRIMDLGSPHAQSAPSVLLTLRIDNEHKP